MKFTLKPFAEMLALSKEKIDEALAPIRARAAKAKADVKIAALDEQIVGLESAVQKMALDKELDLDRMCDKIDELELLYRRRDQFGQVIGQLFPETVKPTE